MGKRLFLLVLLSLLLVGAVTLKKTGAIEPANPPTKAISSISYIALSPTPSPEPLPQQKILETNYHVFQSFNNCGPASLSMALSHYGITVSQQELGQALRPYQNTEGINDDKSVTLAELAEKAKDYDLIPYHRPNGNDELIKQFIAQDMPVITRTWLEPNEDIGHFRVMKGYDETIQSFIQDDSYQNKNLWYTYDEFDTIWKKFNYEYLVLVPKEKEAIAKQILGEDRDEKIAWQHAVTNAQKELEQNPDDTYAQFNLSVAYYHIGNYEKSIESFENIQDKLSARTLWYQIEPIQAYYMMGNYDRVFAITDQILNNQNRAFSELYIIRGDIYKNQGETELARAEYEKAVFYNTNLKGARDALASL